MLLVISKSPTIRSLMMIRQIKHLLLFILLAVSSHAEETPTASHEGKRSELHVYLLIGQSNMAGRGIISDEHKQFPEKVFLLNAEGVFEPATHPLNQYSTIGKPIELQKQNIGYNFARVMRSSRPEAAVGLVVNARGGSGIEHWARGTPYYKEAIQRVALARKQGTLRGILWHQAERNSGNPEGYDKKLAQLIHDLRKDLEDESLPFVAGQIIDRPDTKAINDLIAALPSQVPHTGYVSSEGLTAMDRWHFDETSLLKLGEGYAREMLKLQKVATP